MILRIVRFLTVLVLCSPILALVISTEAGAQTIFNCPSGFVNVTTSPCGASAYGQYGRSYPFQGVDGVSSLVGSQIQIVPVINSHAAFAESWSP